MEKCKFKQYGKATLMGKMVMAALAAVVIVGGLWAVQNLRPAGQAASIPEVRGVTESVGGNQPAQVANVAIQPLPIAGVAGSAGGCRVSLITIPWNATMGLQYANGGRETAAKSLMEKNGVHVTLARQDDYSKIQESQLKFASELKTSDCPSGGAAFAIIMGDGFSSYAAGIQEQMAKIGQSIEVVGVIGKSYGEDTVMFPAEVAKNPQLARGQLVGLVMRDGDYNILVAWAFQNGIPINPDEKTYDPDAINLLATDSFAQADEGVIAGNKCEDRPVVKAGKRTGEMKHICQTGTATWFPGDENVARKKGGMAKVASTADYGNQMAAIIIGNRDFNAKHPNIVKGLLKAAFAGADQVRSSNDALLFAGGVSAKVYNEQSAEYWANGFKGYTLKDKLGYSVAVGGSRVMNAADNAYYFGLSGGEDVYKMVYNLFGDHYVKTYPSVIPAYPKYESVVNLSYLREIIADSGTTAASSEERPVFVQGQKIEHVVSKGNFTIEFDTGKATVRPESAAVLKELLGQLVNTTLAVEIKGHTDSIGSAASNVALSHARADAVKKYLMAKAPESFTASRIATSGAGASSPLADNSTAEGRAKNRRVEITLGR